VALPLNILLRELKECIYGVILNEIIMFAGRSLLINTFLVMGFIIKLISTIVWIFLVVGAISTLF